MQTQRVPISTNPPKMAWAIVRRNPHYLIVLNHAPTQHDLFCSTSYIECVTQTDKPSHIRMITVLGRLFCFCMSPRLAGEVGIEPTTEWLTVTWSTTDLLANTYHKLVRPQGLEPWTYWLKASYSTIELWSQNFHNKDFFAVLFLAAMWLPLTAPALIRFLPSSDTFLTPNVGVCEWQLGQIILKFSNFFWWSNSRFH